MSTQPTDPPQDFRTSLRRFAHDLREVLIFPPLDSDLPRLSDYPLSRTPIVHGR